MTTTSNSSAGGEMGAIYCLIQCLRPCAFGVTGDACAGLLLVLLRRVHVFAPYSYLCPSDGDQKQCWNQGLRSKLYRQPRQGLVVAAVGSLPVSYVRTSHFLLPQSVMITSNTCIPFVTVVSIFYFLLQACVENNR